MKKKVVYVDDEPVNLMIFERMFQNDFDVKTFSTAKDALKYLKGNQVDLIATDQRMSGMTGVEFLGEVKKILPTSPPGRIMISGYSQDEYVQEAFDHYLLNDFVRKPWHYEALKEVMEKAAK